MKEFGKTKAYYGILFAFLLVSLLSSCQRNDMDVRDEEHIEYDVTVHNLSLKQGETALDIAREGDGYLLLKGIPGMSSETVRLDAAFSAQGDGEKTEVRGAVSFAKDGDAVYTYANTGGEGPTYDLYRNGDIQIELGNVIFENAYCFMSVFDQTLYAAIPAGSGEYANCFIAGDNIIKPLSGQDNGGAFETVGFVRLHDIICAAVMTENRDYINDEMGLYHLAGSTLHLFPVSSAGDMILSDGTDVELSAPCRACVSDGENLYILAGSQLCRYDGRQVEELYDFVLAGMEENAVVRRMLVTGDGAVLVLQDNVLLECREGKEAKEKEILTIGIVNANKVIVNQLSRPVAHFNREDTDYAFSVKRFKNADAMNRALLSGEVDAILSSDIRLMESYADRGVLADLGSLCPSLREEGTLLPNVVSAAERKGGLYFLPRAFGVGVLFAEQDHWGERDSFESLENFLHETEEKDPGFYKFSLTIFSITLLQ